jgi:hypothetical protein
MSTIVMLTGGLGNQLFQFKAAMFFSSNDSLILESTLGEPSLNWGGKPEIFSFDLLSAQLFAPIKRRNRMVSSLLAVQLRDAKAARCRFLLKIVQGLAQSFSSLVLSIYFHKWFKVISSGQIGFDNSISFYDGNRFLVGYFQSYKWNNENVMTKLKELKLTENSVLVNYYIDLAKIERPLVVHLRLGDYKSENNFGILSPEYYESAITELLAKGIYRKVWIFSDEPELAGRILPLSITSHARWIPELEGSAAKTLEVMRHGHGYVIGNSTFSWWAAFISHTDSPIVIAPDPWFMNLSTPQDLIPPHWQLKPSSFLNKSQILQFSHGKPLESGS